MDFARKKLLSTFILLFVYASFFDSSCVYAVANCPDIYKFVWKKTGAQRLRIAAKRYRKEWRKDPWARLFRAPIHNPEQARPKITWLLDPLSNIMNDPSLHQMITKGTRDTILEPHLSLRFPPQYNLALGAQAIVFPIVYVPWLRKLGNTFGTRDDNEDQELVKEWIATGEIGASYIYSWAELRKYGLASPFSSYYDIKRKMSLHLKEITHWVKGAELERLHEMFELRILKTPEDARALSRLAKAVFLKHEDLVRKGEAVWEPDLHYALFQAIQNDSTFSDYTIEEQTLLSFVLHPSFEVDGESDLALLQKAAKLKDKNAGVDSILNYYLNSQSNLEAKIMELGRGNSSVQKKLTYPDLAITLHMLKNTFDSPNELKKRELHLGKMEFPKNCPNKEFLWQRVNFPLFSADEKELMDGLGKKWKIKNEIDFWQYLLAQPQYKSRIQKFCNIEMNSINFLAQMFSEATALSDLYRLQQKARRVSAVSLRNKPVSHFVKNYQFLQKVSEWEALINDLKIPKPQVKDICSLAGKIAKDQYSYFQTLEPILEQLQLRFQMSDTNRAYCKYQLGTLVWNYAALIASIPQPLHPRARQYLDQVFRMEVLKCSQQKLQGTELYSCGKQGSK